MKVVFHTPIHMKNYDAIIKMCKAKDIGLEFTFDDERVKIPDYDILIMNASFINPDLIPEPIKIIFGPQLFVFPHGDIVGPLNTAWADRCAFNCLSEWNINVYKELVGSLKIPLTALPFAVDIDKFCPSNNVKDIDCIIYGKRRAPHVFETVRKELNKHSLRIQYFQYGSYNEHDYLGALRRCKFMICIDAHESQGFAIEEAMACNVPLLVLDASSMHDEYDDGKFTYAESHGAYALTATSVPYWSEICGIKITNLDAFPEVLSRMIDSWHTYRPRDYVISTLSPTVCMNRILNYFHL